MFVHRSSSLEELIARLDENLKAPGLRLLEPETILIQSAGMERYLSRELARKSRIAANIRYPFPRAFLHEVLNRALSTHDTGEAFERKNLSWALFVNLERHAKSNDPIFAHLKRALLNDADGLQRLILAEQLAHLFDQYLTYRPRM